MNETLILTQKLRRKFEQSSKFIQPFIVPQYPVNYSS
jgi:hypothetical protein